MKTVVLLFLLISISLASGCGGDGEGDGSAPSAIASAGVEVAYPNGHPLSSPSSDPAVLSVEDELLKLTNDYRVAMGLSALANDPAIRNVTRAHAAHMIIHDFFAHVNPEGDSPGERLSRAGIGWLEAGENLAAGYGTAQEVFNAWLASPEHLANLENPGWTHMGIGYAEDPNDGGAQVYYRYYAQDFVRR